MASYLKKVCNFCLINFRLQKTVSQTLDLTLIYTVSSKNCKIPLRKAFFVFRVLDFLKLLEINNFSESCVIRVIISMYSIKKFHPTGISNKVKDFSVVRSP